MTLGSPDRVKETRTVLESRAYENLLEALKALHKLTSHCFKYLKVYKGPIVRYNRYIVRATCWREQSYLKWRRDKNRKKTPNGRASTYTKLIQIRSGRENKRIPVYVYLHVTQPLLLLVSSD